MDSTKADVVLAPLVGWPASSPSSLVPPPASDPFSVSAADANGKLRMPPLGKLTPLEKKERDRLRKKEQAKRRLERLHKRDDAAQVLQQTKLSSSAWHQKEREEEELVLRRLERDMVFPQKTHPAAAGYEFFSGSKSSKISCYYSPVFHSYSHAPCPTSQLPKSHLQQRQIGTVIGSVQQEATFVHPACHGYAMAKENDCTKVSPVFFFAGFAKIPLERVVLENDDDDEDDSESDQEGSGGDEVAARKGVIQVLNLTERQKIQALMDARIAPIATDGGKFSSSASPPSCAVCKSSNGSTMGCPGCFTFSHERHREVVSSQAAQQLKTPKTRYQEQEERLERHKALQRQLVMPSIYRQKQQQEEQFAANGTTARKKGEEEDYYMHVLVDHQAIRKHRTIPSQSAMYESLTLPYMADCRYAVEANWSSIIASQILSLRVDIKSSIVYVYELYRANVELPNRPIHLLLPTSKGLFYFDERIEDATDVRNGLVFGEFYLEDFNLVQQQQQQQSSDLKGNATSNSNGATMTTRGEFMLFSVAVLNENSTPQLLAHYLQQNFHILPHEIANIDRMPIHHAICALPKQSLERDLCQLKLLPHVQHMQAFGFTSKQLALAEQQRERETLLRVAYLEKKQAKLEAKKKQNQLNQQNGKPSTKVRRAMAYFQYLCESTSLVATFGSPARNLKVWEERLEKLWQCFQFFEEWKICKGGRLIEAETTEDTLALLKLHQQATVDAFDQVLERTSGQGPLLYPILCIGGGGGISTRKLVVKLGVQLGPTAQENREYGLLLDLEQDFDALEVASASVFKDDDWHKMKKRGFTKKSLVLLAQEEEQKISAALAFCADFEWKLKDPQKTSSNSNATLFTNTDLLRPPFYQFKWTRVAKAYKQAMRAIAVQVAKLEEYNALARVLQNVDAILSKAQIEKWQSEPDRFLEMLSPSAEDTKGPGPSSVVAGSNSSSKTSFLAQAARRVLVKKGAALLKTRALQRMKQIREREDELLRLQKLQEENELPRLSLVQQMKLAFVKDKAPQIRAMLELTPAEKLKLKASQLLDKVAVSASSAATTMKKEYKVRAL